MRVVTSCDEESETKVFKDLPLGTVFQQKGFPYHFLKTNAAMAFNLTTNLMLPFSHNVPISAVFPEAKVVLGQAV